MDTLLSINPRSGVMVGTYPVTAENGVACAVERAREAGHVWTSRSVPERMRFLRQLRDDIGTHADDLAQIVVDEIGKPMQDAYSADVLALVLSLDWLIGHAEAVLKPRRIPGERRACSMAMPYGVVGVIGTWNYPLMLHGTTLAWVLAAGNAVVWKPSELATASACALQACFERACLPVIMVTGDGTTGSALCRAPIDKLAFTGGIQTGRMILGQLAAHGTPSVMELSGNDALIVCADADVEAAARAASWSRICNAGQSCVSPQRIYVVEGAYGRFLAACQKIFDRLRAGVDYGPMRTDGFRRRVHGLVTAAVQTGARLLTGGHCMDGADFEQGFYYAPTLLADVSDDMTIMQEDFFGPVLCVSAVRDENEAVAQANASDMGLGASVWTRDMRKGRQIAAQLRAGVITVNSEPLMTGARPGLPFGGVGASGWGRQRGAAGLDEFTQWKTVCWQGKTGVQRHVFPYRDTTLPILNAVIALKTAQGVKAKMQAIRQLADAVRKWNKH